MKLKTEETKVVIFKNRKIRKTFYKNEWWFSVIDIVEALTESLNARDYWFKMKVRVKEEDGFQLSTICRQLKLVATDGKKRVTDCANTEGIFRMIQSIPSPKAEPFKRWLAKVGYERVQEIENPELASQRNVQLQKYIVRKILEELKILNRMLMLVVKLQVMQENSLKRSLVVQ